MKIKKRVLITGASQGLGFELAKHFIKKRFDVVICSRNKKQLMIAENLIKIHKKKNQKLYSFVIDVSKEHQCRNLIKQTINKLGGLDILINNAGIYGPIGALEKVNWRKWKETLNINLFGSILLIKLVLNIFKKQNYGKIIQLSGGGATSPMPFFSAYATSKVGVVRFCESISKELKNYKIDINCVAPGALNTRMVKQALNAGPSVIGKDFYEKSIKQSKQKGSFKKAIELISFLASEKSDGITGKLISAQWDNWKDIIKNIDQFNDSPIFTLKRLIGKDTKMENLDL